MLSQVVAPKNANPDQLPDFWREILRLPLKPYQSQNQENQSPGFEPLPPAQTLASFQPNMASVVVTCSNSTTFPSFTITPQIEVQNVEIQGNEILPSLNPSTEGDLIEK